MNRIRRSIDEADAVFRKSAPKSFPQRADLTVGSDALQLKLHRSRWSDVDYDCELIKRRTTSAKLYANGVHVGSFRLQEYDVSALDEMDDFFYWADNASATLGELAAVIKVHWEELYEISDYGNIVELERGWMHPRHSNGQWFGAVWQTLISRLRGQSLMLLKAYPLEYEGVVTPDNQAAQQRRQKALMRFYRSSLGATSFPGATGERGWMYLIPDRLVGSIPPPALIT